MMHGYYSFPHTVYGELFKWILHSWLASIALQSYYIQAAVSYLLDEMSIIFQSTN